MKYLLVLALSLVASRSVSAASGCAAQLTFHDLTLEALDAVTRVPEFKTPVWELPLRLNTTTPFIIVVGPASARKAAAIKALMGLVPESNWVDVPTHTPEAFRVGRADFHLASWLATYHLNILDVSIPHDFRRSAWADFATASKELKRFGFDDFEVMRVAGVYLVEP